MGKRGPKPKPTTLKILEGNLGKRPLNRDEPKPRIGFPRCPSHLSKNARKAWKNFSKELTDAGIGTHLDTTALGLLCTSYAQYLDAVENVAQFGAVWVERSGSKIPKFAYSPYWAVMNREWKNVRSMLAEFGMTPSSRTGLSVDKPPERVRSRRRA